MKIDMPLNKETEPKLKLSEENSANIVSVYIDLFFFCFDFQVNIEYQSYSKSNSILTLIDINNWYFIISVLIYIHSRCFNISILIDINYWCFNHENKKIPRKYRVICEMLFYVFLIVNKCT